MALQIQGNGGTVAEVESASRALRAALRPIDIGSLGSFRKAMTSGTIAAGLSAASLVFGMRWAPTPSTHLALVRRIMVAAGVSGTAFAAGFVKFDAFAARSYTALESSGGTAGTFGGNNAKLRTAHATSVGMTCYMAATGAISGGTHTDDTDPFAQASIAVPAVAGQLLINPTELFRAAPGEHPLVLASNEGFVIKATVPATGTWQLGVTVDWDEVASF